MSGKTLPGCDVQSGTEHWVGLSQRGLGLEVGLSQQRWCDRPLPGRQNTRVGTGWRRAFQADRRQRGPFEE